MNTLIQLHRRRVTSIDSKWWVIFNLSANQQTSNTFYLDRFRLYYPNQRVEVAAFDSNGAGAAAGEPMNMDGREHTMMGTPQVFSSDNGYEHDFSLDISGSTSGYIKICIRNIPDDAYFTQLYAYPTGYSATRNKDANIGTFYPAMCNPTSFLRLENQPLFNINFKEVTQINADYIRVDNTNLSTSSLDDLIIYTDANGKSNGYLNYSNLSNSPTSLSRQAYDNLLVKKWEVIGPVPPQ